MSMLFDLGKAFFFGGLLCVIAQILIDKTKLSPARILVLYVVSGVALAAIGVYPIFERIAGAGATTPLTGFGNLIAEGVKKEIDQRGFIGILTGGISSAAGGISAALIFGLLVSLIFRSKKK